MLNPLSFLARLAPTLLVLLLMPAAGAEEWKFYMESDPDLTPRIPEKAILPVMVELWKSALSEEGDLELTTAAAADVIRAADAGGDLADLIGTLRKAFLRESRPAVQLNLARTLLKVGDDALAEKFVELGANDVNFAAATFPILVGRGKLPAEHWRNGLTDATVSMRRRRLAFQCAGLAADGESFEPLVAVAMDVREPLRLRLAAAENAALAGEEHDDPIEDAKELTQREGSAGKMLGVRLLSMARQEASVEHLLDYALDHDLAVSSIACARLAQRWPDRLIGIADQLADHPSTNSRIECVRCVASHAGLRAPKLLGNYIADVHIDVRMTAGTALIDLAKAAGESSTMYESVQEVLLEAIRADRWQGHCQAARVADALADLTMCDPMLDMLNRPDQRSCEAAAFFLGRHLPKDRVDLLHQHFKHLQEFKIDGTLEAALIMQAFGRTAYAPAEPDLAPFVPKSQAMAVPIRQSAIWGLGKIYEGQAPKNWSDAFIERVEDVEGMTPELDEVRTMAAVSLGRMNSRSYRSRVAIFPPGLESTIGRALTWAMRRLSDEPVPEPEPRFAVKSNFFLTPVLSREDYNKAAAESAAASAPTEPAEPTEPTEPSEANQGEGPGESPASNNSD